MPTENEYSPYPDIEMMLKLTSCVARNITSDIQTAGEKLAALNAINSRLSKYIERKKNG